MAAAGWILATVLLVGALASCSRTRDPAGPSSPSSTTAADPVGCGVDGPPVRSVQQYLPTAGSDPDLTTLEVVRPSLPDGCGPTPVMVWVHGGGWAAGDRRHQLDDKVDYFTSRGWTLVAVNYRLTPEVRYPVHNDDVAAAVDRVLDRAVELGLDPDRVSLMGHSAGAGIVAGVMVDPRQLEQVGRDPSDLRCAVLLDTEGYDVERMAGGGNALYLAAFGEDPAVWRSASPIRQVDRSVGTPRALVVTRGSRRRIEGATAFADALRSAGHDARLLDASPLGHAEVNRAVGAPGDQVVTPELAEFLDAC